MITRDQLTRYLAQLYDYNQFEDYCENGLQVEGKEEIQTIGFGVSFNMPFLKEAIARKVDALIVHHGIFQSGNFKIKPPLKQKIKLLMQHDISLYGIHLPMDAHPEIGHNALMAAEIGATEPEPFCFGFIAKNSKAHTLDKMLDIFDKQLHPQRVTAAHDSRQGKTFSISTKHGFTVMPNGPVVPETIAIISGGSGNDYEKAVQQGVDTFFCGDIREHLPAVSLETGTNFINLGHYYSERPGVLALQVRTRKELDVKGTFIEIDNPV